MNSRERLRRCFFHQEMDRPGVWVWTLYPPGDASYDVLKAYIRRRADVMVAFHGTAFETPPPTTVRQEPYSAEFRRETTTLHTPAGDLESSRLVGLQGQPGMDLTHFIQGPQDARKYLSLPMPQFGGDVSAFFQRDRQIGDRGLAEARLGSTAAGWVGSLCGSETFALLSLTDRDILHELCRRHRNVLMDRVKFLLGKGVGPIFSVTGPELVCPPLHGPKDFWDFAVKYDRPVFDLLHEAGGRVQVHCHGSIRKVLDGFLEMGADVLHPFEAPPMGDITPAECKRAVRGRIGLEGNIQIAAMYEHTPEQIREETQALIRDAFDDRRGLIVCPSASPYIVGAGLAAFPNFQAMIDTVVQWRP